MLPHPTLPERAVIPRALNVLIMNAHAYSIINFTQPATPAYIINWFSLLAHSCVRIHNVAVPHQRMAAVFFQYMYIGLFASSDSNDNSKWPLSP